MNSAPSPAKQIFLDAVEHHPPDQWAVFLDTACGDNAELRRRVEVLLEAHLSDGSLLDEPAIEIGSTIEHRPMAERPGVEIGPYKLLEQIGEGGFGIVFLAEQTKPVRREVALKIVKAGMDTKEVVGRFEVERQALAMMDHPNIAKVFDAGTSNTGRPYFVMELVPGIPITEYCDQCRLTTQERLQLYLSVCQAVQHAHQKGVIHRDLKPSNVLVAMQDGRPIPKIIDFGVAKAINQRLTENTLRTRFAQIVGTPLYMSPEQAELNVLGVDTRSDIYSLGVLLYELLTGTTPFDKDRLQSASFDELRKIIREEEPPTPSTRLSILTDDMAQTVANRHRTEPRQLTQTVRGDLDWIVMRAMEKDRTRRYETANGLARDIERYLNDEPVEACPPSTGYRIRKFVRRNKAAIAMLFGFAVTLLIGSGVAWWQAVRATAERNRAVSAEEAAAAEALRSEQVAQFLKDTLAAAGPSVSRGRDATLLKEVLENASERVESELADQPEVRGDLWYTLGSTYQDIGDREKAVAMLEAAVDSYRQSSNEPSVKLAKSLGKLGYNQSHMENVAEGRANAQLGLEMARRIGDQRTLSDCLYYRAFSCTYWGMGSKEAIPFLEECLQLRRELGDDPLAIASATRGLSICNIRAARAEQLAREAYELTLQHLGEEHPRTLGTLWGLGQIVLAAGRAAEAEFLLRETHEKWRKVYGESHPVYPIVTRMLAASLAIQNRWDEALKLVSDNPAEERLTFQRVVSLHLDHGQREQALAAVKKMHGRLDELLRQESDSSRIARYQWDLVNLYARLKDKQNTATMRRAFAETYSTSVQARESFNAKRSNDRAKQMIADGLPGAWDPLLVVQLAERAVKQKPKCGDYWNTLGIANYFAENYLAATENLERAHQLRIAGDSFDGFVLAMSHWHLGNEEEARLWYDNAVQMQNRNSASVMKDIQHDAAKLLGLKTESTNPSK